MKLAIWDQQNLLHQLWVFYSWSQSIPQLFSNWSPKLQVDRVWSWRTNHNLIDPSGPSQSETQHAPRLEKITVLRCRKSSSFSRRIGKAKLLLKTKHLFQYGTKNEHSLSVNRSLCLQDTGFLKFHIILSLQVNFHGHQWFSRCFGRLVFLTVKPVVVFSDDVGRRSGSTNADKF